MPREPRGIGTGILPRSILKPMNSASTDPATEISLPVIGMTCASCVNRIERHLNRADGVADANVNGKPPVTDRAL